MYSIREIFIDIYLAGDPVTKTSLVTFNTGMESYRLSFVTPVILEPKTCYLAGDVADNK